MKKKPPANTLAAALHFAAGVLKPAEIAVGRHDVSSLQVWISIPEGAAVERLAGEGGKGIEEYAAKTVPLAALLLFLRRYAPQGPVAKALWIDCLRSSIGTVPEYPTEATPGRQSPLDRLPEILDRHRP